MADIIDRAREYIAKHSEYSEVFGHTFVTVDTLTAMVDFAKRETKELEARIEKMKCCAKCAHCNTYITSCIPQKRFVRLEDVCEDFELRR